MLDTPAVVAEQRKSRARGVVLRLAAVLTHVPRAIRLLMVAKPVQSHRDGLLGAFGTAEFLDDFEAGLTLFSDELGDRLGVQVVGRCFELLIGQRQRVERVQARQVRAECRGRIQAIKVRQRLRGLEPFRGEIR